MTSNVLGSIEENKILIACSIAINSQVVLINLLVFLMFIQFRKKLLTTPNNMFLFSMSVADLCVGCTGIIDWMLFLVVHEQMTIWKLGGSLPFFASFFLSILSLGLMTTDRLISVTYSLQYAVIMTARRASILISLTWLTVVIITISQGVVYLTVSPWMELKLRCFLLGTIFFVGVVVLGLSNTVLYKLVRQKARNLRKTSVKALTGAKYKTVEVRNSNICILVTILFIFFWLPLSTYCIGLLMGFSKVPGSKTLAAVGLTFAPTNALLNPCVYLLKRKDFRRCFRKLFYCNTEVEEQQT